MVLYSFIISESDVLSYQSLVLSLFFFKKKKPHKVINRSCSLFIQMYISVFISAFFFSCTFC